MKILTHKSICFSLFLLVSVFLSAQLNSTEIKNLKYKIKAATLNLNSLQSDFTQTKHLDFLENDIKSSGKLYFKSKSKIRWEYVSPFSYYVIFKDEKMFVNDNGKKKQNDLSSNQLKDLNRIMLGTVQGIAVLDENKFNISYSKNGKDYLAKMLPTDKTYKKYIQQIDLTFDGSTFLLKKIKITEPSLDYTSIEFSNQKKNTSVADEKFSFK